eukprot:CAMPEP_0179906788 /NCGR_PEP_ID=MMETSP0982-20121206/43447_1 /TAXON_ID=483367 /ORGANISM="non described non described, Strain CCMP 2436" /LENGTH=163 /DNA_ID=CAMNT_0021807351 /DNA_START=42 /DNA_END=532 /DNA_ORIENTATION=-
MKLLSLLLAALALLCTLGMTSAFSPGLRASRVAVRPAHSSAVAMMPKFLKKLFPNLEKPDDPLGGIKKLFGIDSQSGPSPLHPVQVEGPSDRGGGGMSALPMQRGWTRSTTVRASELRQYVLKTVLERRRSPGARVALRTSYEGDQARAWRLEQDSTLGAACI